MRITPDTATVASANGASRCQSENHVVQFYETDAFLCEAVSSYLADGLIAGQPLLVIATEEHRAAFAGRLAATGFDFEGVRATGDLSFADAHRMLGTFMVDGVPDEQLFWRNVGGLVADSVRARQGATVRAYGEMVDVLWREGNAGPALRVEELWNDLAMTHTFSLLCAYAMGHFHRESHRHELEEVCLRHGRVLPAETYTRNGDDETRLREVALLQQRAHALENEVQVRAKLERALRRALAERRQAEETLRLARDEAEGANRAKSEFLAVLSHELRTPLNAIVGYEDLLDQEIRGPVNDEQRQYLGRIRSAASQLLRLIDQVLSLSQIEAGRVYLTVETVDLAEMAAEAVALVERIAASKGVQLNVGAPGKPVLCHTDGGKVRQIMLNLLSNAAKFTAQGSIDVVLRVREGFALFEVRDTGVGIDAADIDRIFEPFVQVDASPTRQHGGTGLGLPVSRQLAALIGADLAVESAPGRGSRFVLRLPLHAAQADAATAIAS